MALASGDQRSDTWLGAGAYADGGGGGGGGGNGDCGGDLPFACPTIHDELDQIKPPESTAENAPDSELALA